MALISYLKVCLPEGLLAERRSVAAAAVKGKRDTNSRTDWPVSHKLGPALDLCVSVRPASNARKRDSIRDSVPPGRATVPRRMRCVVRSRAT